MVAVIFHIAFYFSVLFYDCLLVDHCFLFLFSCLLTVARATKKPFSPVSFFLLINKFYHYCYGSITKHYGRLLYLIMS